VIVGSVGVNPGFILVNNKDVPQIADEYRRSFRVLRSLPCDIPLGSHPAMYGMAEKYAKLGKSPNPFIDPQGYKTEVNLMEQVFNTEIARQQKEAAAH
jgi:metallo-beta-lactamase class B